MRNKNKIIEDQELVGTLKMLAEAYEEISVLKMQKVRGSVLTTREFLDGLSEVFVDVKKSYGRRLQKLIEKRKVDPHTSFTTKAHNGKKLSVLLSANSKFYGDIVRKVFDLFIENVRTNKTDILVIGRTGKEMMDQAGITDYSYVDIPDGEVELDELKPVIDTLVQYEKVDVYYGRFSNMINQLPTVANVSGQSILEAQESETGTEVIAFAFEPSLEKILDFFENQVFVSLFKQTINESELARLASRIRAMEEALGNIEKFEPLLSQESRALHKAQQNKKQLEVMTSISFLRQHHA